MPSRLIPRLLVVFTRQLEILVTTLNNGLLLRNVVQLCLAANNILLMRKRNDAFLLLPRFG